MQNEQKDRKRGKYANADIFNVSDLYRKPERLNFTKKIKFLLNNLDHNHMLCKLQ